jgi:hypothetical protein
MAAPTILGIVALLGVRLCSPKGIGRDPREIPHVDPSSPTVSSTVNYPLRHCAPLAGSSALLPREFLYLGISDD